MQALIGRITILERALVCALPHLKCYKKLCRNLWNINIYEAPLQAKIRGRLCLAYNSINMLFQILASRPARQILSATTGAQLLSVGLLLMLGVREKVHSVSV